MDTSVAGGGSPGGGRRWSRLSRRDRALALVVPGVMAVVALVQNVRAHTVDQSSWAGAGFGMFATVDEPPNRWTVVTGLGSDGEVLERIEIPAALFDPWVETLVVPTDANLARLGRALATHDLEPAITTVSVQVYGLDFDGSATGETLGARAELVNETLVER